MFVVIGRLGLVPCQRGCVLDLLQALDLRQSEECALAFREFRALRRIEPKQRIGHAAAAHPITRLAQSSEGHRLGRQGLSKEVCRTRSGCAKNVNAISWTPQPRLHLHG